MTVDALLNIVLITYFNNPIEILAVSNIGYVFATCTALAAFLLLRKDRPRGRAGAAAELLGPARRPCCSTVNFVFLVAGGFLYSGGFLGIEGYGYGWDKTRWGLLVLAAGAPLYVSATWCRTSSR